jgi:hypothetical protein
MSIDRARKDLKLKHFTEPHSRQMLSNPKKCLKTTPFIFGLIALKLEFWYINYRKTKIVQNEQPI